MHITRGWLADYPTDAESNAKYARPFVPYYKRISTSRQPMLGLFACAYIGLTEKVHFFKQTLFPASQNSNSATAKFYTKEAGASYPGSLPEIEAQSHIHW
jgi:hypothetical protein